MTPPREPYVEARGRAHGLEWAVVANTQLGYRCGYVRVPLGHPLHGQGYRDPAPGKTWELLRQEPVGKRGVFEIISADLTQPQPRVVDLFNVHGSLTFTGDGRLIPGLRRGWWLGFDCGHAGDARDPAITPPELRAIMAKVEADVRAIMAEHSSGEEWKGVAPRRYKVRTLEYARRECERLASQVVGEYPLEKFPRRLLRWAARCARIVSGRVG